jgi:hypothetical protein
VWGCNIRVIIVPSILALAYLGPSSYFDLLPVFNLSPLGTWLAADGASIIKEDAIRSSIEENTVISGLLTTTATISSLVISMAVNALVTGLIVWRILKVLREVQGSISARKSSGAIGLRGSSLIFVISESGVALFSVQLIRVIFTLPQFLLIKGALDFIVVTHQMLNVIITFIINNLYFADNVDLARV